MISKGQDAPHYAIVRLSWAVQLAFILYYFVQDNVPIVVVTAFNPLNAKLNPICHMLALLGARHILHVSNIRVNTGSVLDML